MIRVYNDAAIIITGAASGIGRALAVELARRGAHLCLVDLQEKGLQKTSSIIANYRGEHEIQVADVTDIPRMQQIFDDFSAQHGRLDYLFNNAGIGVVGDADLYEPETVGRMLDVNFTGVVQLSLHAYKKMKKQGFGHIVNTSSMAGLIAFPWLSAYVATKFGIVGFSKSLRAETAKHGVRVSAICPGLIVTPITYGGQFGKVYGYSKEALQKWVAGLYSVTPQQFAPSVLDQIANNPALAIAPKRFRLLYRFFTIMPDAIAIKILQFVRRSNQSKLQAIESRIQQSIASKEAVSADS